MDPLRTGNPQKVAGVGGGTQKAEGASVEASGQNIGRACFISTMCYFSAHYARAGARLEASTAHVCVTALFSLSRTRIGELVERTAVRRAGRPGSTRLGALKSARGTHTVNLVEYPRHPDTVLNARGTQTMKRRNERKASEVWPNKGSKSARMDWGTQECPGQRTATEEPWPECLPGRLKYQ